MVSLHCAIARTSQVKRGSKPESVQAEAFPDDTVYFFAGRSSHVRRACGTALYMDQCQSNAANPNIFGCCRLHIQELHIVVRHALAFRVGECPCHEGRPMRKGYDYGAHKALPM